MILGLRLMTSFTTPTTPGTMWAEPGDTDVESSGFVPDASAGTMSIDNGGELSFDDGSTWVTSGTYVVGTKMLARGDAHATLYSESIDYVITGIDYSATYTVTTIPAPASAGFPYELPLTLE